MLPHKLDCFLLRPHCSLHLRVVEVAEALPHPLPRLHAENLHDFLSREKRLYGTRVAIEEHLPQLNNFFIQREVTRIGPGDIEPHESQKLREPQVVVPVALPLNRHRLERPHHHVVLDEPVDFFAPQG